MPTLSPPRHPHERLQVIYSALRTAYTNSIVVKTSKPRKKKVRPKEVEALKARVESIEGSEVVETTLNTGGEAYIIPRPEELTDGKTPSFNGA